MRVLVVEDFAPLREALVQGLLEAGFAVDAAKDGQEGLWHARSGEHDVIVLDLMLPKLDGLTILKELRGAGGRTGGGEKGGGGARCPAHILVLTAKDTAEDRVKGLDLGADDYLIKPFVFAELLARVRALVRRKYETKSTVVRVGDLEIDSSKRVVKRGGQLIDLSGREYALLEYLAMNADRVVSRADIWQHVYDFNASLESNVVDVFVGLVRKKIERPGKPRLLHTRRGQGYMLSEREAVEGAGGRGTAMMRSLRARLLVGTTAASAVIFIVLATAIDQALRRALREEFDAVLLAKAKSIASMVEVDGGKVIFAYSAAQFPEFSAGTVRRTGTAYFQVWLEGRSFVRSESLGEMDLPRAAAGGAVPLELPDHRPGRMIGLRFIPFVEHPDETGDEHDGTKPAPPTAVIVVAQDTADMEHLAARLGWLTLGLSGGAMLLSGAALWWVVGRAIRPVQKLAAEIGGLSETDLAVINGSGLPAELAPVVDRLNGLLSRLGEAFTRERSFTADVAHELRTPLAGLLATLEVCRSRPRDSAGYETAIDKSLKMLIQMQGLVENLLLLARADGGLLTLRMTSIELGELIRECLAMYEARAGERGLSVVVNLPESCVVQGDRELLRIVMRNLFDNAVSHANEGGSIAVEIVRENPEEVRVRVKNSGNRVAAEELQRVFDRFWRKESARSHTGLHAGLGLSISRRLMTLQGGELKVSVEAGEFCVTTTVRGGQPIVEC